jgi:hypothetical protein
MNGEPTSLTDDRFLLAESDLVFVLWESFGAVDARADPRTESDPVDEVTSVENH